MELNVWIRTVRTALGLSQSDFGDKFSKTKGNVSAWETGKHEPSYRQIVAMSRMAKVPLPDPDTTSDDFPAVEARAPGAQLSGDELRLVRMYRASLEKGRRAIMQLAQKSADDAEQIKQELGVAGQPVPQQLATTAQDRRKGERRGSVNFRTFGSDGQPKSGGDEQDKQEGAQ